MTQPIERDAIYRRRRFPREVIEGCARWYLTYRLSYRDLVALMAECGVHVSHTTIMHWVYRYAPEYEKRWSRRAKPVGASWRVDETYIRTRPKTGYLYRAVDKEGKTVASLFHPGRGITAAMAFFRTAVESCAPRWPRKITLDGHKPSHVGLRRLRREDHRWKYVLVRTSPYLNNVIEQDHRAIKGRCQPMMGFKSYRTAAVTLAGPDLAHRIRKRPRAEFGQSDSQSKLIRLRALPNRLLARDMERAPGYQNLRSVGHQGSAPGTA